MIKSKISNNATSTPSKLQIQKNTILDFKPKVGILWIKSLKNDTRNVDETRHVIKYKFIRRLQPVLLLLFEKMKTFSKKMDQWDLSGQNYLISNFKQLLQNTIIIEVTLNFPKILYDYPEWDATYLTLDLKKCQYI